MKRIEFAISNRAGDSLQEPGFVEECSDLPLAVMRAIEDFLEANGGKLSLPITIQVNPAAGESTC